MRRCPLLLCVLSVFSVAAIPQTATHPRPPGLAEGQKQIDQPLERPMEMRNRQINVEQVRQEAEELRRLADRVPAQIQQVTNNQLPKDLRDNLKRIEKLAKHLHSEVTP
jgi:TolA-binding protein